MDSKQAYLAMYAFLESEYELTGSDELGGLLGSLSLLPNGDPADPAVVEQWETACEKAISGTVDATLRLME